MGLWAGEFATYGPQPANSGTKRARHAGRQLICPYCSHRYLPDESAAIDDRYVEQN